MKKARYRGIPAWFNPDTGDLKGRNWFYDILIDFAVWYDFEFGNGFLIYIEAEESEAITSSKPDYSWLIYLFFMAWASCVAVGCQSKKKSLHVEKQEQSQQSEVKKEYNNVITDSTAYEQATHDNTKLRTIEEWQWSSGLIGNPANDTFVVGILPNRPNPGQIRYRKITYQDNDIVKVEKKQSDLKQSSSLKLDSVGKSESKSKLKVQDKDVKDNLTGKATAVGFLVLVVLMAVVYIRFQMKANRLNIR